MLTCLLLFLILQEIFVHDKTVADYQIAYNNWMADYEKSQGNPKYCPTCVIKAHNKAAQFGYTLEKKYAVRIINLYTQQPDKTEGDPLYRTLNIQIREKKITKVMAQYKDMLFLAIGLLYEYNKKTAVTVFRGSKKCHDDLEKNTLKYDAFTSTTLDPGLAFSFGTRKEHPTNCQYFTVINGATGLNLEPYSEFPKEKEVLLINGTNINVIDVIENKVEIDTQMKKIWPFYKVSVTSVSTLVIAEYKSTNTVSETFKEDDSYSPPDDKLVDYFIYSLSIYIISQNKYSICEEFILCDFSSSTSVIHISIHVP